MKKGLRASLWRVMETSAKKKNDNKNKAREHSMELWQSAWDRSNKGRWTYALIPTIKDWIPWGPPILNFHLTQMFQHLLEKDW